MCLSDETEGAWSMKRFAHTALDDEGAESARVAGYFVGLEVQVVKMLGVMKSAMQDGEFLPAA